ncbi:MAG: TRAP transporter large permease [Spirochaetes bacterium]|nr:TRAP transporter large permease [Spirochaetota bacterium]
MSIIIGFLFMVAIGIPVGFCMVLTGFFYIISTGSVPLSMIPQAMVSGVSSYTMLAIPFFIVVGELMNSSGITRRIFNFSNAVVGHITGGLGLVNVLGSMIFAGMSGSAVADAAGLGAIEIKAMKDEGFDADFAVGITAASSILGPIIPPSSPMVLFGIVSGVSIGAMFMGGLLPGILLGIFQMIVVYFIAKKRGYPKNKRATFTQLVSAFWSALPALLCPILLIGGIFSGFFTPTEAAAVALFYALFIGFFVYKELTLKRLWEVLGATIQNLGIVMLLMASGKLFSWVLGMDRIAEHLTIALFSITNNPSIILLLINILLLIAGTFMETNASIFILTPILLPIAVKIGMHPVQFGVMMIFNLMIGLLTPPMAIILFITSRIGGISFERSFKAVKPYLWVMFLTLFLMATIPGLTLAVPKLILGKAF